MRVNFGRLFAQKIQLHLLDVSKPRDVIKFADDFVKSNQPLDVLVRCTFKMPLCKLANVQVNNAGAMINQRELTEDGLERNFATNTLGVFATPKSPSYTLLCRDVIFLCQSTLNFPSVTKNVYNPFS